MESYGLLPDGREATLYTLANANGMVATITNYGATLVGLVVPDAKGDSADVTLGYDTISGWLGNESYFGSTVGRYGNRIAHGRFELDGETHTLATNNDPGGIPCHLHGGIKGFDKALWEGRQEGQKVILNHLSPDGEEGYPGNLAIVVTYELTDENELIWSVTATTDRATPVNIVHHTYWNLTGDPDNTILDHELMVNADHLLITNAGLIPTGELADVTGTPFDFREATTVGARIEEDHEALKLGGGYDHCFVLRKGSGIRLAARVTDPSTGRTMELSTDQPGVQFYTGNFLDGTAVGKDGKAYERRTGLCLETEGFPDAPNQPDFPSTILRPGETYSHTMVHRFSW